MRREIELAIDEKRNIVPLFFKGFRFGVPSVSEKLTGKLKNLSRYNGLNVHEDYFQEAMQRVRAQFLSKPLDTVLHPVSIEVRKAVEKEQVAADRALEQIEDVKELVKQAKEKPVRAWKLPKPTALQPVRNKGVNRVPGKAIPYRLIAGFVGGLALIVLCIWGGISVWNNLSFATPEPTRSVQPTPALGVGSTLTGKDGMTLLYIPAGEFTMGSETNDDEKPIHKVTLNAFWIDQTEVTVHMYYLCVQAGECKEPTSKSSFLHSSYYGNSDYDNYPVIYVDWYRAKTYCEWVDRRLPTEAEWEKAARGENAFTYPWGNDAPNNSLLNYRAVGDITEVGKYPNGASPYGALDMAGNVWEWVADWYDAYPGNTVSNSSYGTTYRVLRGGAGVRDYHVVRSADRGRYYPILTDNNFGFRCASSP